MNKVTYKAGKGKAVLIILHILDTEVDSHRSYHNTEAI